MNMMGLKYEVDSNLPLSIKDPDTGEMVDVLFWERRIPGKPLVLLIHPDNRGWFERKFPKVTSG